MDQGSAVNALSALGHDTRLRIYLLLAAQGSTGFPAGAIALELGVGATVLSSHLAILTRAGLIEPERVGRSIIYRARRARAVELADFILAN